MTQTIIASAESSQPLPLRIAETSALSRFDTVEAGLDGATSFEVDRLMGDMSRDFGEQFKRRRPRPIPLRVALIDRFKLSRDCLVQISTDLDQVVEMAAFASVDECAGTDVPSFDLILYNHHAGLAIETTLARTREVLPGTPVIVLSSSDGETDGADAMTALRSGARGFVPTRTTGISMLSAAIGVVMAGGTFAPLELVMMSDTMTRDVAPAALDEGPALSHLTARQKAVLSLIRQGKANKIIAHELKMSESTVKVHVRNVLRKMGATNRTQAAYHAQRI